MTGKERVANQRLSTPCCMATASDHSPTIARKPVSSSYPRRVSLAPHAAWRKCTACAPRAEREREVVHGSARWCTGDTHGEMRGDFKACFMPSSAPTWGIQRAGMRGGACQAW